ncbi:hypothetical protein [Nesterenkonia alba]|uniref:hypothetical protein n=1 Tax=Nesterenkonia alba TaxID=515814 RepID=UPI000418E4E3|nr:hypothetical protein [Nesterenkonia alba]
MASSVTFIRLKLKLFGNTFSNSAWIIVGTMIGGLYGFVALISAGVAQVMQGSGGADPQLRFATAVLLGSVMTLLWIVLPVLLGDPLMDPKQFIPYGIPRRELMLGLTLSSAVSLLGIFTVVFLVGQVLLWRASAVTLIVAVLTTPVAFVLCALVNQAASAASAAWLSGSRFRNLLAIVGMCAALTAYPLMQGVIITVDTLSDLAEEIAAVTAFTPLGAVYALPHDVAEGDWGLAALRLGIVVLTAVAALWVTKMALIRVTEKPASASTGSSRTRQARLGLLGRFPGSPVGAVAARQLIYWIRDARYGGALALIPAMIVLALFMSWQTQMDWLLYIIGPLVAWMISYQASADISYDHTAFALHVTSGLSGQADRLGRAVAVCVIGVPAVLLAAGIPMVFIGTATQALVMIVLSLSIFFSVLGLAVVFSAKTVYPVPKPGESPFKQPQGAAGRVFVIQTVTMLFSAVVMIPDIVLLLTWFFTDSSVWLGVYTVVALTKAAALFAAGIRIGARVYDAEAPEIYQRVRAH